MTNQRGYTILEALLALVVLSLLSMPIYRLLSTEHKLAVEARDKAGAYFLATNAMEKLKAEGLKSVGVFDSEDGVELNGKRLSVVRKVRPRFEASMDSLKVVEIGVYFHERRLAHLTHLFGGIEPDTTR